MDLDNLTGQPTIIDIDWRPHNDSFAELLVGTSHTSVVSLDLSIDGDDKLLSFGQRDWLVLPQSARLDLWSLGVQHDCTGLVLPLLQRFLQVIKGPRMSLQKWRNGR